MHVDILDSITYSAEYLAKRKCPIIERIKELIGKKELEMRHFERSEWYIEVGYEEWDELISVFHSTGLPTHDVRNNSYVFDGIEIRLNKLWKKGMYLYKKRRIPNDFDFASLYSYYFGERANEKKNKQEETGMLGINYSKKFGEYVRIPGIKKVIFHDPATIVYWNDGTKTVVKCQDGDIYDAEKGLAMAISKKALGNKGNFNDIFKEWVKK